MTDIVHQLHVAASPADVYRAVTTPAGLDAWWTKTSAGRPEVGTRYEFGFGPGYDWRGEVVRADPEQSIVWIITEADDDWTGTRVAIELRPEGEGTSVLFRHTGWRERNAHCRISSYCWAAYLRLLRRYVMHGEIVPYEDRLDV